MKSPSTLALAALLLLALSPAATAGSQDARPEDVGATRPDVPAEPQRAPTRLVRMQPFVLDEGYVHAWRAERPVVTAGYLIAVATDRDLLVRRQTGEPVLYAGAQTAERLNDGTSTGVVVAIVPVERNGAGRPRWSAGRQAVWFGDPELPERVTARAIAAQARKAARLGVSAPRPPELRAASLPLAPLRDRVELEHLAADWIEELSPDEVDLVFGLRGQ